MKKSFWGLKQDKVFEWRADFTENPTKITIWWHSPSKYIYRIVHLNEPELSAALEQAGEVVKLKDDNDRFAAISSRVLQEIYNDIQQKKKDMGLEEPNPPWERYIIFGFYEPYDKHNYNRKAHDNLKIGTVDEHPNGAIHVTLEDINMEYKNIPPDDAQEDVNFEPPLRSMSALKHALNELMVHQGDLFIEYSGGIYVIKGIALVPLYLDPDDITNAIAVFPHTFEPGHSKK